MDNFKAAVRSLLSTPGPTLVVIVTLAIAIGANTAIFSIVDGVLLRPLYDDDDRLVVLWTTTGNGADTFRLSPADYRDMRGSAAAFDGQVLLYRSIGSTLTALERPVPIGSLVVASRIFDVLGVRPAVGQFFADDDENPGSPKKVVITHESWTRRFGADPALIGSILEVDNIPRTLIGVTEPGFSFPPGSSDIEVYFPMGLSDGVLLDRDHRMFDSIARLADGVSLEAARSELAAISSQLAVEFPDTNTGWSMTARPLRTELLGDLSTLWVLTGAVFLVLLIVCANIANVLVARSAAASREFAVRAALGARRSDLCKRSLAESLLLGSLGAVGGLLLAFWGTDLLRSLMPAQIPGREAIGLNGTVLMFAAGLSIGASMLFGALPALRSMTPDLGELLKPAGAFGSTAGDGPRLRELMVVVEVALAIVLLVGAGLMVRSFARLSDTDPGFRRDGVVSMVVRLTGSRYSRAEWRPFFEQLVERVEALPGVHAAGAVSNLPMGSVGVGFELDFTVLGLDVVDPTARPNADIRLALPGYFDAMDMEIVNGRAFDVLDATSDRPVAIVNETLVDRYFPGLDPIGQSLDVGMVGKLEIAGVVANIRHSGLQNTYESEIFLPYGRLAMRDMNIVVHSDLESAAVASAMIDVLADIDPELAASEVGPISDLLWESMAQPRFNTAILSLLALCATILAVVGTYGIVAYSVTRRTSEIGVRMALGADSAATVAMIVRQTLRVVLIGGAVGIVGALGATRFLRELLFDVQPTDPLTYAVVLAGALAIGLLAAWLPARRATRVDPVTALRVD